MKKETIEEAIRKEYKFRIGSHSFSNPLDIGGQQERMYSEKEVIEILYEQIEALDFYGSDFKFADWFEEHKKKFV